MATKSRSNGGKRADGRVKTKARTVAEVREARAVRERVGRFARRQEVISRVRGTALNAISRIGAVGFESSTSEWRKAIRNARSAVCRIELPDHDEILLATSWWCESEVLYKRRHAANMARVIRKVLRDRQLGPEGRAMLKGLLATYDGQARNDEREDAQKEQRSVNRNRVVPKGPTRQDDEVREKRWRKNQNHIWRYLVDRYENARRGFLDATKELLAVPEQAALQARWQGAASDLTQKVEDIFGTTSGKRGRPRNDLVAHAVLAGLAESLSYGDMEAELGFWWSREALKQLAKRCADEEKEQPP